jgi:hypothetical protein
MQELMVLLNVDVTSDNLRHLSARASGADAIVLCAAQQRVGMQGAAITMQNT